MPTILFSGWIAVINLLAVFLTLKDKRAAVYHRRRIPEATLLWVAFVGGAVGMLATMKRIRHKTRKAKFMVGLPMMIVLHITVAVCLWLWIKGVFVL